MIVYAGRKNGSIYFFEPQFFSNNTKRPSPSQYLFSADGQAVTLLELLRSLPDE